MATMNAIFRRRWAKWYKTEYKRQIRGSKRIVPRRRRDDVLVLATQVVEVDVRQDRDKVENR